MARVRIGVDVGGTFTDFSVLRQDGADSRLSSYKVPSTPDDPSRAVGQGVRELIEAGLDRDEIEAVVHGTTIGLNAILQRSGARAALVVSEGHRDVLEIARSRMPSSFDLHAPRHEPLVDRADVWELPTRVAADGAVVGEVPDERLDELAARLRESGVEAVAVSLIGGYRNPEHEGRIRQRLADRLGGVPVSSAALMWPEIREYERSVVAVLNAHIVPLMHRYFDRLLARLRDEGVTARLYITASNGGSLTLEAARERPLDTVLSGPASGVRASATVAPSDEVITFDMGGTSSDMALVRGREVPLTTGAAVGDFPLMMPVVEVNAIGAGGGSLLWADRTGEVPSLRVGPRSAGAHPGPASYGNGGTRAAVTDCYVAASFIDPARFLGGRMPLDADAADAALAGVRDELGWPPEMTPAEVAWAALELATAQMSTELRKQLVQRGSEPSGATLLPYGGAGPTHAALLAEQLGVASVFVPATAATYCALGAAVSPLRRDLSRTLGVSVGDGSADEVREALGELMREAEEWIVEHAGTSEGSEISVTADLKYLGQAYELIATLGGGPTAELSRHPERFGPGLIREAFEAEHRRLYGFVAPGADVGLTNLRVSVQGARFELPAPSAAADGAGPADAALPTRELYWGGWVTAAVLDEEGIARLAEAPLEGPLVIDKPDTTVVVPAGWTAGADGAGNVLLQRKVG